MLTALLIGWLVRANRKARAGRHPYVIAYAPHQSSRPELARDGGILVEL